MLNINDKTDSTPGATGELTAAEYNDHKNELQGLVTYSAQALSILKTPDQVSMAAFINGTSAQSFQDNSATANSIELTPITGAAGIRVADAYASMDGAIVEVNRALLNTSTTVTVNIGQTTGTYLGAKSLKRLDGTDPAIGEVYGYLRLWWDNSNDYWVIIPTDEAEKYYHNFIINPDGAIAQRGTTITAATLYPNDDDSYTMDKHLLLSDGNDIVKVSRDTDAPGGSLYAIKHLVGTANKKFGFCRFIENEEAIKLTDQIVSIGFQAKVNAGSNIDNIRAAVISWDGAADTITSDVVSVWNGAGTNPTLVANWTYENTPANMAITDSYQLFTIGNIEVDTASMANLALFVWVDDVDAAINDEFYVSQIRLIKNNYLPLTYTARNNKDETRLCQGFFQKSYNIDTAPGTITDDGEYILYFDGLPSTAHTVEGLIPLSVASRTNSYTITTYDNAGTADKIDTAAGAGQVPTFNRMANTSFSVSGTNGAANTIAKIEFQWTIDDEL
jgi:hypothetical protein